MYPGDVIETPVSAGRKRTGKFDLEVEYKTDLTEQIPSIFIQRLDYRVTDNVAAIPLRAIDKQVVNGKHPTMSTNKGLKATKRAMKTTTLGHEDDDIGP